ncbi:MAG: DUF5659 domain-containing protein [Patescibacteria group bacterium]
MSQEKENEYSTKDLSEAGALIINGLKMVRIDRQESVCFFIFDNKTGCEKIANQFLFGKLKANLREYYEILTILKRKIFNNS